MTDVPNSRRLPASDEDLQQAAALRLADRVDAMAKALPAYGFVTTPLVEAAAELRRLHSVERQLNKVSFVAQEYSQNGCVNGFAAMDDILDALGHFPPSPAAERAQERGS